ncbi:MAG TPA: hypothetical protein VLI90_10040 [Tepidisphaeraceae bacterium]|nr:hypothetical protein [Tepidisphaeraceae bacterium]
MRRARYLLVATLLLTAVCADRAVAAAPALRPEMGQLAERLVNRLSASFSRTVSAVRMVAERQQAGAFAADRSLPISWVAPAHPQPVSPFQFRLPPPAN